MATKVFTPLEWLSVFKVTTRERYDWITPLAILGLSLVGIAFIYSAQFTSQKAPSFHEGTLAWMGGMLRIFWVKQIIFLCLGAAVYVLVSLID